MLFRYIGFRKDLLGSDKICSDCIYLQDKIEVYEYGKEFVRIAGSKEIKTVLTILRVIKNLPEDIRINIFLKTLITEFKDEIFINQFDRYYLTDLELAIAYDDLPQHIKDFYNPDSENSSDNLEIDYLNYNSDNDLGLDY